MKSKRTTKILAFSSFIGILIFSLMLIGVVQNQSEPGTSAGLFLLLLGIAGLSLLNLFQIMKMTAEKITPEDYLQKSVAEVDEEAYQANAGETDAEAEEDNHQLDPDVYEKKIIPDPGKQQDLTKFTESLLSNIAREFDIVQGLFYVNRDQNDAFTIAGKFAYFGEQEPEGFHMGQGLPGQTAKNQRVLRLSKIPENYVTILSGLGSSSPNSLLFAPVVHEEKTIGLIEMAAFKNFDYSTEQLFNELSERLGKKLSELL